MALLIAAALLALAMLGRYTSQIKTQVATPSPTPVLPASVLAIVTEVEFDRILANQAGLYYGWGDVNADGAVDSQDLTLISDFTDGTIDSLPCFDAADVSFGEVVDAEDQELLTLFLEQPMDTPTVYLMPPGSKCTVRSSDVAGISDAAAGQRVPLLLLGELGTAAQPATVTISEGPGILTRVDEQTYWIDILPEAAVDDLILVPIVTADMTYEFFVEVIGPLLTPTPTVSPIVP